MNKLSTVFGRCLLLFIASALLYADCSQKSIAEPIAMYRSVTVSFTPLQDDYDFAPHQIVTVKIQKYASSPAIQAKFIFDTGSSHCAITSSLAAKLGLPQRTMKDQSGDILKFDGVIGLAVTPAILAVGALQVEKCPLVVLSSKQATTIAGQPIDGVLGANFWSSFVVHLDFTRSQITFTVPGVPPFSFDNLGKNPIFLSHSDLARQGFGTALVAPMLMFAGGAYAAATVSNGPATTVDFLLVDSGSDASFLSKTTQRKLNLKIISTGIFTGIDGQSPDAEAWLPGLTCGDLNLNNIVVHLAVAPNLPQSRSILGLDALANYDVLWDFPHQKMYLKPRSDLQIVTSRQYEAALPHQKQEWARKSLVITCLTSSGVCGIPIPYQLTQEGLPVAQVRPDLAAQPVLFLLKTNTPNTFISDALAQQWRLNSGASLDSGGKPQLMDGDAFNIVVAPNLYIGGMHAITSELVGMPSDKLLSWTSYSPVSGMVGGSFLFMRPLLMNPVTQTWIQLTGLHAEDLPSLEMADAAAVDILDPDKDGIPAVAVQVQQDKAQATDTMTLATGSPFTLLSAAAAKALNLMPEPQKLSYGVGKDITVFNQAHLTQLSIGGVVLKDVAVAYPIGAMPNDFYPRLGMNVISRLRLLVDTPGKKMYVKIAGPEKAAD